jgi:hypothetical protein
MGFQEASVGKGQAELAKTRIFCIDLRAGDRHSYRGWSVSDSFQQREYCEEQQ